MVEVALYLYPPPDLNLYNELYKDLEGTYAGDYNCMVNNCDHDRHDDYFSLMTKINLNVNSNPVDIYIKDYRHLLNNRPPENQEKLSISLVETGGEILPKADVVDTDGKVLTTYEQISDSIYEFNFVFYRNSENNDYINLYFATPYISNNHYVSLRNKYA